MTSNYTCDHAREHACIGMHITTSTDGDSLSVSVGNVINQFNSGLKLVGITSDCGTNLVRQKAILESTFENKGVFDLENPIFVMECLDNVLINSFNSVVTNVKSDDGRVDTEVTRSNM